MNNTNNTRRVVHVFKSKYKRKDGKTTWSYRFEMPYRTKDGKREFATKSGFLSKTSAMKAGEQYFDELYKGFTPEITKTDNKISRMRFSDYIEDIWIPYKRPLVKESSMYGYEKLFRNLIIPKFGNFAIADITTTDIESFLNNDIYMNSTISNCTLQNVRALLKQVFEYAVKKEYLYKNPVSTAALHNVRKQPNKVKTGQIRNAITTDVLDQIYELYPKGTLQHLAFKMMEQLGLRVGEVFALDWRDISFNKHTIYLVRQEQRRTKSFTPNEWEQQLISENPILNNFTFYISNPKYESCRAIPMTTEIEELLKDELESQKANRRKYGEKFKRYYYTRRTAPVYFTDFTSFNSRATRTEADDYENGILNQAGIGYELDFVFRRHNGEHFNSGNMQYASRKIHGYEGNEVISETFNVHSLRHTYASRMRSLGFEEYIIKSIMGHKEQATITQMYMHLEERVFNQVIDKLNSKRNVTDILKSLTAEEIKELSYKLNNI